MTIATSVTRNLYTGTGSQIVFPYTFKVFKSSDLRVIRRASDGTETTLTLTTHYTVDGVGDSSGGNVTLVGTQAANPPTSSEKLLVMRVLPLTQETSWADGDAFPASTINNAMDRATCQIQQMQEQLDRALIVSPTSSSSIVDPDKIASDAASSSANAAAAQAAATVVEALTSLPVPSASDSGKVVKVDSLGAFSLQSASTAGSDLYLATMYPCMGNLG